MLAMFNTKKDNEPYHIPCPLPSSIIPQHAIDVLGPLRPSVRQLSGSEVRVTMTEQKEDRC